MTLNHITQQVQSLEDCVKYVAKKVENIAETIFHSFGHPGRTLATGLTITYLLSQVACSGGNLNEEYRSNEENNTSTEVYNVAVTPVLLHHVDDVLADIIAEHVEGIMSAGYAEDISGKDFFHGHFYVSAPEICNTDSYRNPRTADFPEDMGKDEWIDLFLKSDPYIIYHTREFLEHDDPYDGPPRSIIGTMEGNVYPMKALTEHDWSFISMGSVKGQFPFEFNGQRSEGMCDPLYSNNVKLDLINKGNNKESKADFKGSVGKFVEHGTFGILSEFWIMPDPIGRYELSNGNRFDIFYQLKQQ